MIRGSVNSIETMGLVDGPGIRTVVFLNSCFLRCKYCHNPETWKMGNKNMTVDELVKKVLRSKPYFKNGGGVTFSGGEPLLQDEFLLECCKRLKEENIHIAIDTAGYTLNNPEEILKYVDLVLLDIKHVSKEGFKKLTGGNKDIQDNFIRILNKSHKKVWIRQVIVPGVMDNDKYLKDLSKAIKSIKNVERIDFLPYHKLGREKYIAMGINYPLEDTPEMNKEECNKLYKKFMEIYKEN
jgi:pyruvate formate lyase activating enzyme